MLHWYWFNSIDSAAIVPKRNKRKPKKKTKGAPKFRHQGRHWVDQRLSLHVGLARHGPQGEDEVFRLEVWRGRVPKKAVLFVMARFQTPSEINDFFQLCYCQFFKNHSKQPAKVVRGILVKWSIFPPGVIFRFLLWKMFIVFSKNLRKKCLHIWKIRDVSYLPSCRKNLKYSKILEKKETYLVSMSGNIPWNMIWRDDSKYCSSQPSMV